MQISKLKIIFTVLLQLAFIGQVFAATHKNSTFEHSMVNVEMSVKAQCLDVLEHSHCNDAQSDCCEVDCDVCSCAASLVSGPLSAPSLVKTALVIQEVGLSQKFFQASLYRPPIAR